MEVAHVYTKVRKEFGKHPDFSAVPAQILEDDTLFEKWIMTAYEAAKRIEMKKFKYQ